MNRWCIGHARAMAAMALGLAIASSNPASSEERTMTGDELKKLYEDKTWDWGTGGGYFGKNRRFRAQTGRGAQRSWIDGRWSTDNKGIVCFKGRWKTKRNKRGRYEKTCFEHRAEGLKIYQRRLPRGQWYLFRDHPPQPKDQTLKDGDQTKPR